MCRHDRTRRRQQRFAHRAAARPPRLAHDRAPLCRGLPPRRRRSVHRRGGAGPHAGDRGTYPTRASQRPSVRRRDRHEPVCGTTLGELGLRSRRRRSVPAGRIEVPYRHLSRGASLVKGDPSVRAELVRRPIDELRRVLRGPWPTTRRLRTSRMPEPATGSRRRLRACVQVQSYERGVHLGSPASIAMPGGPYALPDPRGCHPERVIRTHVMSRRLIDLADGRCLSSRIYPPDDATTSWREARPSPRGHRCPRNHVDGLDHRSKTISP